MYGTCCLWGKTYSIGFLRFCKQVCAQLGEQGGALAQTFVLEGDLCYMLTCARPVEVSRTPSYPQAVLETLC